MSRKITNIVFIILLMMIFSCKQNYYPKPYGYIRTDFPQKEYRLFDSVFPYIFEIPVYSKIDPDSSRGTEKYWSDWNFPKFNATVFISYKEINNNLNEYEEDTRELVYKHTIKADNIEPIIWNNEDENVYGILYDIKGNVASQIQFYLTDSVRHFVRGSFYFNCVPNKDSLSPSLKFIKKDIDRMIETFKWKNEY